METLLRIGLSNAVAALLLALLVVTVACIWRRPAVLHALWLLVLVKLVTPPLVWLPEPWTDSASGRREPADAAPLAEPTAPPPRADAPGSPVVADVPSAGSRRPLAEDAPADLPQEAVFVTADVEAAPTPAPVPVAPQAPAAPWWLAVVFGLWLAGALGWFALALVRLWRFRRLLRHAVPAPESLRQRTQRLAEKLRLRRRPAVWLAPGRIAPMLWAVGGSPRILFPSELLGRTTTEQQNALLVHELAHLRRRDHWVRWLEFAASGLYWWNPVLWFARRELREAEEHCCDAWVTSTLPDAGKTYAVALLETLDFLSDASPAAPLLASGVGRVADLKRRLTMIMRGTTPRTLGWRGLLAVLGLGAFLLPLLPAWARAQAPDKPAPPATPARAIILNERNFDVEAPASPEDLEKAKAQLKELEAQLAQKQAETAEIAAKVEALRAKLAKADGPRKVTIVLRVDSQDAKYAENLKRIVAAQPVEENPKVIVIDAATNKVIMEKEPQGKWVIVPEGGLRVTAPPTPADADKRIDELEKKLKSILDEVEQLRRERKPGDAPPLHSYGPTPLEQLPIIGRLYTKTASGEEQAKRLAAERDALQKMLQDVRAQADVDRARGDAAVEQARAAVLAAEAALRQADAQKELNQQVLSNAGAASEATLKQSQAEADARRADLEAAKANLDKATQDKQIREADMQDRLKAAEADRQAAEAKIKQLEEELRKLKEASGDAPKHP